MYRVLARKYRPQTFADLVGQEVLVRTLGNAIKTGRVAHAFLLTGIRGIGKTTTARIIARALNCIGADGNGGATIDPCGVCANCVQIRDDRHVDVMEMDAASRTGVGDIRDLIETVHYAPTNARYKIYIIDEVHMLTTNAFNALLKTLEEPPPSVIFIFATTEIRKIPVTILSRCQRFDLKRLDMDALALHLQNICGKENVTADETATRLIAMAAEGSVRDALSLLDQAISQRMQEDGTCHIDGDTVRGMLGLADRGRVFALMDSIFAGDINASLQQLNQQYQDGAEMGMLVQDMLAVTHSITRLCLAPQDDLGPTYSQTEREEAKRLGAKLNITGLTRAWQMLLKGLDEVRRAPDALAAAEMLLIRLTHASTLPPPTDLLKTLRETPPSAHSNYTPTPSGGGGAAMLAPQMQFENAPMANFAPAVHLELVANNPVQAIVNFEDILELCSTRRESRLRYHLENDVGLVSCSANVLTVQRTGKLTDGFAADLSNLLRLASGNDWKINFVETGGALSITAQKKAAYEAAFAKARQHPLVLAVLNHFDGAELINLKTPKEEKS